MTRQPHTLPIEDRLRQLGRGERNAVGDLWQPLFVCDEAADIIAALYGALDDALTALRGYAAAHGSDDIQDRVRATAVAALSLARGEGL